MTLTEIVHNNRREKNENDNSMRIITADDCNAAIKEDIEGRSPRRIDLLT